ncbi:MAG: toll/interleukin-1 receptor domain-containing protein [Nitrospira sp.]|nr:toll/interleukin-1 receptor domain-containing protein [Nitrospira sp.]MCA9499909.1 toll/interleukin-1 receptor domain-containing protein [Nitrospira sp.]
MVSRSERTSFYNPKKVFISYRRNDASGYAGRLYDHLVEHLGDTGVFYDVNTIPPGENFETYIEEALADCFMCIVVIGRQWDSERLHSEHDFVRREIIAAFSREIRVVPMLFDGAKVPEAATLPSELAGLAQLQAYDFGSGRDFKQLVTQLIKVVELAKKEARQRHLTQLNKAMRDRALPPHHYPIWVLFLCGIMALSVVASGLWVPRQLESVKSLWVAEDALLQGQISKAINAFLNVLEKEPNSRQAKIGFAMALFQEGSTESTVRAINIIGNMTLSRQELERLNKTMPEKYQRLFSGRER